NALGNGKGLIAIAPNTCQKPCTSAIPPVPDEDVNLSGTINAGDVGAMFPFWGQASANKGWVRQDANNSGVVNVGDVGKLFPVWGGPGYLHPNSLYERQADVAACYPFEVDPQHRSDDYPAPHLMDFYRQAPGVGGVYGDILNLAPYVSEADDYERASYT